MFTPSLQVLIGTALTDASFRHALLNGSRLKILKTFPLSRDEIDTIMAIRADSLEQFAGALHNYFLASAELELEPLPRVPCLRVRAPVLSRPDSSSPGLE